MNLVALKLLIGSVITTLILSSPSNHHVRPADAKIPKHSKENTRLTVKTHSKIAPASVQELSKLFKKNTSSKKNKFEASKSKDLGKTAKVEHASSHDKISSKSIINAKKGLNTIKHRDNMDESHKHVEVNAKEKEHKGKNAADQKHKANGNNNRHHDANIKNAPIDHRENHKHQSKEISKENQKIISLDEVNFMTKFDSLSTKESSTNLRSNFNPVLQATAISGYAQLIYFDAVYDYFESNYCYEAYKTAVSGVAVGTCIVDYVNGVATNSYYYSCDSTTITQYYYEGSSTCSSTPAVSTVKINDCKLGENYQAYKYECSTSTKIPTEYFAIMNLYYEDTAEKCLNTPTTYLYYPEFTCVNDYSTNTSFEYYCEIVDYYTYPYVYVPVAYNYSTLDCYEYSAFYDASLTCGVDSSSGTGYYLSTLCARPAEYYGGDDQFSYYVGNYENNYYNYTYYNPYYYNYYYDNYTYYYDNYTYYNNYYSGQISGYYYINSYSGKDCTGETTFSTGMGLDKCINTFDSEGIEVGSIYYYCDGYEVVTLEYSEIDCLGSYSESIYSTSDCINENYGQGLSLQSFCSSTDAIPVDFDAVILKGYNGYYADFCDTDVVQYVAYSTNYCFFDDYSSYDFSCATDSYIVDESVYLSSKNCTGYAYGSELFTDECYYDFEAPIGYPTTIPTTVPTAVPTTEISNKPTVKPSTSPSSPPTFVPTSSTPSIAPSVSPTTANPTPASGAPTFMPSLSPSLLPSTAPTLDPTTTPSVTPSTIPTAVPTTQIPTESPSLVPTNIPTAIPSLSPTLIPTTSPSSAPTANPSIAPTELPSIAPTILPTLTPSVAPTILPTILPTVSPTALPTISPTIAPTALPTISPTIAPTVLPTIAPTALPSNSPTVSPTTATPTTATPTTATPTTATPTTGSPTSGSRRKLHDKNHHKQHKQNNHVSKESKNLAHEKKHHAKRHDSPIEHSNHLEKEDKKIISMDEVSFIKTFKSMATKVDVTENSVHSSYNPALEATTISGYAQVIYFDAYEFFDTVYCYEFDKTSVSGAAVGTCIVNYEEGKAVSSVFYSCDSTSITEYYYDDTSCSSTPVQYTVKINDCTLGENNQAYKYECSTSTKIPTEYFAIMTLYYEDTAEKCLDTPTSYTYYPEYTCVNDYSTNTSVDTYCEILDYYTYPYVYVPVTYNYSSLDCYEYSSNYDSSVTCGVVATSGISTGYYQSTKCVRPAEYYGGDDQFSYYVPNYENFYYNYTYYNYNPYYYNYTYYNYYNPYYFNNTYYNNYYYNPVNETYLFNYFSVECYTPTVVSVPTKAPVARPTPKPIVYTQGPTYTSYTSVIFSQLIYGCGYANYSMNPSAYNSSILFAIVESVYYLTYSDIIYLEVFPALLESSNGKTKDTTATYYSSEYTYLSIEYLIESTSPFLSDQYVISALNYSVISGLFTDYLEEGAYAYGATGLYAASTTDIQAASISFPTAEPVSSPSSNNGLSPGLIALTVILVVFGVAGIAFAAYYFLFVVKAASSSTTTTPATPQRESVVTIQMQEGSVSIDNPMTTKMNQFGQPERSSEIGVESAVAVQAGETTQK